MKQDPSRKKDSGNTILYAAVLITVIVFVGLIAVAFLFSSPFSETLLGKCVGVVNIDHEITVDSSPTSMFNPGAPGSEDLAAIIEELDKREDIGALLFVMNTPGGSAVASREVYDAVKSLKKPKVAYFREISASGGYYISTAMDYIISDPNAITGSIGVVATFTDMSGLLEKVGINATSMTSGPYKDIGSPTRRMTEEERQIINALIQEVFVDFKGVVLEGRGSKLDKEKFEEILDGRIVSGRQAKEIGLIDGLGTKKDALRKAADMANMKYDDLPRTCEIKTTVEPAGLFGIGSLLNPLQTSKKIGIYYN